MPKRVLVIDDDPSVHLILNGLLKREGYDVLSAETGEKGLQVALSERPNLIILDVIMPGIKGRDLCVKIKAYEVLKNIPVVFLTAKDSPDDLKAEWEAGGLTHLNKPINPEHLLRVVNEVLNHE